jgi:hypothetical protein
MQRTYGVDQGVRGTHAVVHPDATARAQLQAGRLGQGDVGAHAWRGRVGRDGWVCVICSVLLFAACAIKGAGRVQVLQRSHDVLIKID